MSLFIIYLINLLRHLQAVDTVNVQCLIYFIFYIDCIGLYKYKVEQNLLLLYFAICASDLLICSVLCISGLKADGGLLVCSLSPPPF